MRLTVFESRGSASARRLPGHQPGAGPAAAGHRARRSGAHLVETVGTLAAMGVFFVALTTMAGEWLGDDAFAGIVAPFISAAQAALSELAAISSQLAVAGS